MATRPECQPVLLEGCARPRNGGRKMAVEEINHLDLLNCGMYDRFIDR
jgi:hypothetical protein